MASSAPVVKAGLLTTFRARSGLSGVQVEWSNPATYAAQEYIWFGQVIDQEKAVALGRQSRDEDYTLEVIVLNVVDGDDAQTVETRWWAIVAEIEAVVKSDPTLGGTVNLWAIVQGIKQRSFAQGGQRGSEGTVTIECHNRK